MASGDARPMPLKNVAYRVTFPVMDADGDLVTGATALDSEISKDGGTFADCTNEATEIATSSGMYYLDLSSTEMNADTVAIIVKTSSSGAKTTPIVLYPAEATDIPVNVTAWNGTAVATPATAGYPAVTVKSGTGTGEVSLSGGKALLQDGAVTAGVIATTAAEKIADGVWDEALSGHTAAGSAGKAASDAQSGAYIGGSTTAATNAARGFQGLVLGTAVTGTLTATGFTTSLTEATNDHYNGRTLTFTSGALAGQMTTITDYNGSTKLVTVTAMTEAPSNGDQFFIA